MTTRHYDVAIIGSGFAGLCAAIRLKDSGRDDFIVLEREPDVGGTWWVNSYPGCACDVPSHLYSYSFEPNPDWSRSYSGQAEIQAYLRNCAEKYGLMPKIRLNTEVRHARYDEASALWQVELGDGTTVRAAKLVSGVGGLSLPRLPDIPGQDRFAGVSFHSQHWDHDADLAGRRVAVIGTGASAIQFVPHLAEQAQQLLLFQRHAPWILPKLDRDFTRIERWLFRHVPGLRKLLRGAIYTLCEVFGTAFRDQSRLMRVLQFVAKKHMQRQVPGDAERQALLTPDYAMGCKRVLFSNEYYPAVARDNVQIITTGIREITERGLVTEDGVEHAVDVIVYGTGFETQRIPPGLFFGRGGMDLAERWAETGMEAYLGTTISGFPNLFVLHGPNVGQGHTSVVYMIEGQVRYLLDALRQMDEEAIASVEVRREIEAEWNAALQRKLEGTVWQTGGCHAWYHDHSGKNVTLWPEPTWRFNRATARFQLSDYSLCRTADAADGAEAARAA